MSGAAKNNDTLLLNRLNDLPRKIIGLHGQDNITEFVLHELCNKQCFDIKKAAYFIDNPDFNCLKGVAGFSREEAYPSEDLWQNPQEFTHHMRQASFNQKVRSFMRSSLRKNGKQDDALVQDLAGELKLPNNFYAWEMKHDNHGLLIYESNNTVPENYLKNGVCLLSFCPIF